MGQPHTVRQNAAVYARSAALALLTAGAISMGVAATPGCSSDSGTVTAVCPPGKPCQTRLTLLHTADIHSRLFPYDLLITQVDGDLGLGQTGDLKNVGGVARMAYILGRERARADRVLHLDSGDCFQGAPIFNFYSGEPEVRAMSILGTDAQVIGNHEFDKGAINVARQYQRFSNFPFLGANYKFDDAKIPGSTLINTVLRPFEVFNQGGLKIAVIGMGNISTITSVFDQPNKTGILPLNTVETAQGYIDLLRPYVDVIVMLTHLGLQVDQNMIANTTGIDVVLGGHNHIVINPPQQITDCTSNPQDPGFIWETNPNVSVDPKNPVYDPYDDHCEPGAPPPYSCHQHPNKFRRVCTPRRVVLAHSGAFAKYVGRLDLMFSNDPADVPNYDPLNGFEVVSSAYQAFPIDDTVPEDPVTLDMLQPYRRTLDRVADLDILVGYSPQGAKRTAPQGGDAPLGNLVATAAWLRLAVQTDFSLTNTTGIRADLNPGPITIEEMYNIFPFDNSITKMQLSGLEVQQLFDYVARRSETRGCVSQAQIAGARVRVNCAGCSRPDHRFACNVDADCPSATPGACDGSTTGPAGSGYAHMCVPQPCAEEIYIGQPTCETDSDCRNVAGASVPGACFRPRPDQPGTCTCTSDHDCAGADGAELVGQCAKTDPAKPGRCWSSITPTNLYELATSNYLAAGGSGYRVLQRNTTQFDTQIQQRDALVDYLRQGKPCGWADPSTTGTTEGLKGCSIDAECGDTAFVCACPAGSSQDMSATTFTCKQTGQCDPSVGRCVLGACRDQVAAFHDKTCAGSPDATRCRLDLNTCSLAGEECKFLSCVDKSVGNLTDNRLEMLGR